MIDMEREEAIKKVRWGLLGLIIDKDVRDALETLIPELAESEDERMLRTIIRGFENWKGNGNVAFNNTKVDDILAYLEKQKEQKDYRKLYEDIAKSEWFKKAYEGKSLGCDDEQKKQNPELVQHPPITYTYSSDASRDEQLKRAIIALLNSDLIKVAGN